MNCRGQVTGCRFRHGQLCQTRAECRGSADQAIFDEHQLPQLGSIHRGHAKRLDIAADRVIHIDGGDLLDLATDSRGPAFTARSLPVAVASPVSRRHASLSKALQSGR